MTREWKPSDVAATEFRGVKSVAMVVDGASCVREHPRSPHWHGRSGGWNPLDDSSVTFRPLVVIDPEDREQVERLAEAYVHTFSTVEPINPGTIGICARQMQAALRSLIEPPKPDEPTGLGAVVEDAEGRIWTRIVKRTAIANGGRCWISDEEGYGWHFWLDLSAVRVLSEGVPS